MIQRIDGRYVHKIVQRNVLLSRVERRSAVDGECFEAEMVVDGTHPFFFEHPLDHIPAMMLVEAGRQLGIAISHLYLGVPLGTMFATKSFDIRFTEFAETNRPVLITATVRNKKYRHGELFQLYLEGRFSQGEHEVGWMGGSWVMLKPELWKRYRRREQQRVRA
jgi:hypothetical protein